MKAPTEKDCYIGIQSCGCIVAWVSKESPDAMAEAQIFVRQGLKVEPAVTDEIMERLGSCKCAKNGEQSL